MAITRLTDFITVATSKWTYGDSSFKYEGEVNQDHDTIYPLMVMTPPTSRMPDIYEGWEYYNVEMEFYNSYQTAAQNAVTLQQRWDNLQDLALEWLDNVLINYSGGTIVNPSTNQSPTPTEVYIDKETVQIDRIKNDKNDKLCRITMRFDMRMFTRCFTPKSLYPNTITELKLWLKADSSVTFSIPTKQVSAWADQSDVSSDVSQTDSETQPLRYGYDGPSDKAQIVFDGTDDNMLSIANSPFSSGEMTFFIVSKCDDESAVPTQTLFSMNRGDTTICTIKYKLSTIIGYTKAGGDEITNTVAADIDEWAIYCCKLQADPPDDYKISISINGGGYTEVTSAFTLANYSTTPFQIGCGQLATDNIEFLDGNIAEIIGYDKALDATEKSQVLTYLNNKYKIY
tara:strand:+ start:67 stop:1266 length:1200 start_codon:yes stop_codon:yes gene_type:complete